MITLLNSPLMTCYGQYEYRPLSLAEARSLVRIQPWRSAVGHQSTAQMISELLDIRCPANRMNFRQQTGESALVFSLAARPPEGAILSRGELESIGYAWALITRTR